MRPGAYESEARRTLARHSMVDAGLALGLLALVIVAAAAWSAYLWPGFGLALGLSPADYAANGLARSEDGWSLDESRAGGRVLRWDPDRWDAVVVTGADGSVTTVTAGTPY